MWATTCLLSMGHTHTHTHKNHAKLLAYSSHNLNHQILRLLYSTVVHKRLIYTFTNLFFCIYRSKEALV